MFRKKNWDKCNWYILTLAFWLQLGLFFCGVFVG